MSRKSRWAKRLTLLFFGLSLVSIGLCQSQSAHAAIVTWDGGPSGTDTDIGVAANWVGDVLPSVSVPDTARFDGVATGPLSLVYQNTAFNGAVGNVGMLLDVTANQTSSLNIDAAAGAGSIRLNNTAVTIASGAGPVSFGNGSGTNLVLTMGGTASTQTLTNNSSNVATINSDVRFSNGGGGSHIYQFTGMGDWTLNNPVDNAVSGQVTLGKSGSGVLTLTGANTYSGLASGQFLNTNVSGGTLNINGSHTSGANTGIHVGATDNVPVINVAPTTSVALSGGNSASILISNLVANQSGVVNHSTGTVSLTGSLFLGQVFGAASSYYGFYNKTGGTLTHTGSNRFRIGQSGGAGSAAVFYHSSGTTTTTVGIVLNDISATAGFGGAASLYVSGGTMTSTVGTVGSTTTGLGIGGRLGQSEVTIAGTGSVTLNGQTSLGGSVAGTPLAGDANRVAILNLGAGSSGGSLQTSRVILDANQTPRGYLNFNGGTLKAQTANAGFLNGLTQVTVHSGGGTIDNNGVAITIGQNLVAPAGDGVTNIPVSNGGSGYRGAPYVQISGGGSPTTPATAVANLDSNGSVTSITITNPGTGYTSTPTISLVGGLNTGGTAATLGTPSVTAITGGGLTFQGTNGITTLTGTGNTYSGVTNVSSGTLRINGVKSGSGAVNVANGATLGGTGSIAGNVAVSGNLAPGESIGTLALTGNVTIDSNGFFQVEYNSTTQTIDLAEIGGAFDINGGTINFADLGSGALTEPSYVFATFLSGSRSYTALGVPVGYFVADLGTSLALVSAVPEASAFLCVGLVGAVTGVVSAFRRKRR